MVIMAMILVIVVSLLGAAAAGGTHMLSPVTVWY
jgi:hypothetical protein